MRLRAVLRPLAACAAAVLSATGACSCTDGRAQEHAAPPADARLDHRCGQRGASGACALYDVSMIELIARPERFDGRAVRVIGFVNLEFEGNAIYNSEEDWRRSISRNGLWITPPDSMARPRRMPPQYMLVEGTFNAAHTGHMGMWSGAIEQVTRFEPWRLRGDRPIPEEAPPPPR